MDFLPRQADDVDEQTFGQTVLAHHRHRQRAALLGQLEVAITGHVQQTVALHAGHRLADRGATLFQPLRDACAQRGHALFLEVVDGAQIHLGGIDQVVH